MARITVEDCLKKIDSQYDLVLLAKERTTQLNSGEKSLVPEENDKNTVIALREIGDAKISIKTIEDSAINKLRKIINEPAELEDLEIEQDVICSLKVNNMIISAGSTVIYQPETMKHLKETLNSEVYHLFLSFLQFSVMIQNRNQHLSYHY